MMQVDAGSVRFGPAWDVQAKKGSRTCHVQEQAAFLVLLQTGLSLIKLP
ncbi:MAG: hypothetical protein OEM01_11640 [Desulfobulbaceae bacterium]|nr:hypothetical protein [Desulfobulbaceae bacterium]